ncbi:hypothetical protein [Thalassotalea atypica]|uniref:hypothetical protein n=1 Tax=Thalassotalea atypica TaxID=2054316 RepID=UPI0025726736|nr:hypothetical protein [Thalassotalea atypica]
MQKINTKITRAYRYFFYTLLVLLITTGSSFWLLRRFGMVEGDFGPESHYLQYPALQLHGLCAFLMLMSLGAIFASHVPRTWSTLRARKSGISILVAVSVSALSAYSLYYLVSQDWHTLLGNSHAIVGLVLPLFLWLHIYSASHSIRKKTKEKVIKKSRFKQKVKKEKT